MSRNKKLESLILLPSIVPERLYTRLYIMHFSNPESTNIIKSLGFTNNSLIARSSWQTTQNSLAAQ